MVALSVTDIIVSPLKRITVSGGDVLHGIKRSDPGYFGFGEAYFSTVDGGAIKAWKRHLRMTLNLIVPVGAVQFCFFDSYGKMFTCHASTDSYVRITVPPYIWFGFKGLSNPYSLLLNISDIPHDPDEVERRNLCEFNFDWESSS